MKILFSIILLLNYMYCWGQFGPQQIISTETTLPREIVALDINNDNLIDIASASRNENNISWFRNDGNQNFSDLFLIANSGDNYSISYGDIDNDGDQDIISTSFLLDTVFWCENIDGQGTFNGKNLIASLDRVFDVATGDINGDGLIDVVYGSTDGELSYNINTIDNGFNNKSIVSNNGTNGRSIELKDLDMDGDLDILTSNSGNTLLSWYENLDGMATFSNQIPLDMLDPPSSTVSVNAIDIDNDNDLDIIAASAGEKKVVWYENLDGNGSFANASIISLEHDQTSAIFGADLDNDNDVDIIATSAGDNLITWYENLDGNGNFGSQQIISTDIINPRDVIAVDLDNDTDIDVVVASQNDNKISWYENLTVLNVEENLFSNILLTPNPVTDILNIESGNIFIEKILFYNQKGIILLQQTVNTSTINLENLKSGIYFIEMHIKNKKETRKIIKI